MEELKKASTILKPGKALDIDNGVQLEKVCTYKYLCFLLTPSGEINSGLHDLRGRALKVYMKLRNNLETSFNQDIMTTLTLVDAMIKPILLLGMQEITEKQPDRKLSYIDLQATTRDP